MPATKSTIRQWRRMDRIVQEACRYLGISQEELESRSRRHEIVEARQLVCHLLLQAGYGVSQVGLRLQRDHSTVRHAQRRVESSPVVAEQAQELVDTILPFVGESGSMQPTRDRAISRVLLGSLLGTITLQDVRAVRAYVLGTLVACERVHGPLAIRGLIVIAEKPRVRQTVEATLTGCGLSAYAGLIPLHLRHLGVSRTETTNVGAVIQQSAVGATWSSP
jgi:hypothetical protein